jgi:hypothetical protein
MDRSLTLLKIQALLDGTVAAAMEKCATIADAKRDASLHADLLSEPLLWVDGYEHGCRDVAVAIRNAIEEATNED